MVHFSNIYPFKENRHYSISPKVAHQKHHGRKNHPQPFQPPPDIDTPPFYLPLLKFSNRYKAISNIGNGSFGSVTLAKINVDLNNGANFKAFKNTLLERNDDYVHENVFNKNSGLVAIKKMTKRLPTLNDYTRVKEVRFVLSLPYHRNMVQIYEMFIDDTDFKLHIVMECLDQNLYQLIKARKNNHFSQFTLRSILSQLLNGIRHIHRNEYFHRDVKPENILVSPSNRFFDQNYMRSELFKYKDNFVVKIADYGLARHIGNKKPYTSYVSTRWYRAPEILLRKKRYSRPVDIWAFGSVAAEVATFRPLFPGSNELEQTWRVLEILGTPMPANNTDNSYFPSYGYWEEAIYLSSKLGLQFPQIKCIDVTSLIPSAELRPLCDVIRACLAWNPDTRADVEQICQMPYFRNTCVDDYDYHNSSYSTTSQNLFSPVKPSLNIYNSKSEKLNGIPVLEKEAPQSLMKRDTLLQNLNSDMSVNHSASRSRLSNLSTNEVNLSFLSELNSLSTDLGHYPDYDDSTNQLLHRVNAELELKIPPQLTGNSTDTENDENLDIQERNTRSLLQINRGAGNGERIILENLSSNPNIASVKPVIQDRSYLNSPGDNNRDKYRDDLKSYAYDAHGDYEVSFAMADQDEPDSGEFINWNTLHSNSESLKNLHPLIHNGSTKSSGSCETLNDSLLGLYERELFAKNKDYSMQAEAEITDRSDFSEKLYSRYNLRGLDEDLEGYFGGDLCLIDDSFDFC